MSGNNTFTPIVGPVGFKADKATADCCEILVKRLLEPICGGVPLWDIGIGDVVRAAIEESATIPKNPVTAVDMARALGVLKQRRRAN